MNGPIPTTRVFLSEIGSLPLHAKVRFLGWYVNKNKTSQSPLEAEIFHLIDARIFLKIYLLIIVTTA